MTDDDLAEAERRAKQWLVCVDGSTVVRERAINEEHLALDIIELCAEVRRLQTRQQELLAAMVRITNETPFPDEAANWTEQRAKLLAEIGTLKAQLAEARR